MAINWKLSSAPVSKYFTVGEVTQGDPRRIPKPNSIEEKNIILIAKELDKIREEWQGAIGVTSWYRPYLINLAVGGVPNSQHVNGSAVDVYSINGRDREFENFLDQNFGGALGFGVRSGRGFTHLDLRGGGWRRGAKLIRWNY